MANNDSDSESEQEAPKHLPLNQEELAILESYLEQWDSASSKEKNKVWKNVTTEAQLKAPKMAADILMSQKTVYRKWLQNHGDKKDAKALINLGRKWTYRTVVGTLRKKELLKQIEDETRVKPREKEMMKHYSKYLAEMWNKIAVPPKVQADIAKWKSREILRYVVGEMFKKAGMRMFMLLAWKSEEGKLMISSHDFNNELGNGESFEKTCDWMDILPEWKLYMSKQFDKEVDDKPVVKKGRKDNTYMLEMGIDGVPVLPDHESMDLDTQKAVVQAFLNWHYRGKVKDLVPWKEVIWRQEEIILPLYLLDGEKLREPLQMTQNEANELLDFWYDYQKNCQDVIFKFCGWWSKADKEVKPPVGWVREFAVMSTQTQKTAGQQMTRASTRGKSNSWAVVQSTGSDDEDDRVQSRKITKAATQTANGDRNARKKCWMSTSQVVSEAPDALIHRLSLLEGTSGNDMPVTGMRKAQMNMKKQIDRKSRNSHGEHPQTSSWATHLDVGDDGITEQSAFRAPDATADQ
ncbi:hypothetical protein BDR06DRAFT_1012549 [Suillus hirtellus]|nr:hypothetical protein BDR06DRAFT_1012549 [Suillus hirtellus]